MEANTIYWEFTYWIEKNEHYARVEGEKHGRFYTARCYWIDESPNAVIDVEEIPESELYNKPKELTKFK